MVADVSVGQFAQQTFYTDLLEKHFTALQYCLMSALDCCLRSPQWFSPVQPWPMPAAGEIFCTLFNCRISLCCSTWTLSLTCLCCPSASPLHVVLQLFLLLCVDITWESIWLSIIYNTSVTESLFNAFFTHEIDSHFGKLCREMDCNSFFMLNFAENQHLVVIMR